MKSCFIVNYWADSKEKADMVVDSIKQLKKTGRDVIYTSLRSIDQKISDESRYSLFSNSNDLIHFMDMLEADIPFQTTTSYETENFKFYSRPLNSKDVSYCVSEQLINSFKTAKSMGYTHCHFIVGDCFITDEELYLFDFIEKACSLLNKRAYFDDISKKFGLAYSGVYFYSEADFFISNFVSNKTKREYLKKYSNPGGLFAFEQILYKNFIGKSEYILSGNNDSFDFGPVLPFNTSRMDMVQSYNSDTQYHVVPLDSVYCVIVNSKEPEITKFKIVIDEAEIENSVATDSFLYLKTDKKSFNLKIFKNGIVDFEHYMTEEKLKKIANQCFFDTNKRSI